MKLTRWNRWVATNIHLDHSSPLRKQWSPLHEKPPWGRKIYVEPSPWLTTFPSEGVGLLWSGCSLRWGLERRSFCKCNQNVLTTWNLCGTRCLSWHYLYLALDFSNMSWRPHRGWCVDYVYVIAWGMKTSCSSTPGVRSMECLIW